MRKLKRSLAMFLSLIMVLSLMAYPISVRAEGGKSIAAGEMGDGETLLIDGDEETKEEEESGQEEDRFEETSDESKEEKKEDASEEESDIAAEETSEEENEETTEESAEDLMTDETVLEELPGIGERVGAGAGIYDLWIIGIQVTEENKDNILGSSNPEEECASFDPDTQTLTLKNARALYGQNEDEIIEKAAICSKLVGGLNIYIIGNNWGYGGEPTDGSESYGIYVENGNLTINGEGTLSIDSNSGGASDIDSNYGVYCDGSVIIESGNIYFSAVKPEDGYSYGIYAEGDFQMKNGRLTAVGGSESSGANEYSCGIWADNVVLDGGYLSARGEKAQTGGRIGIHVPTGGSITVNDGTLEAHGYDRALSVVPSLGKEGMVRKVSGEFEPKVTDYADYKSGDITGYASVMIMEDSYHLWIGGVLVTKSNCAEITGDNIEGTVSYNPVFHILTLSDAAIAGDRSNFETYGAGIYADKFFDGKLGITVTGDNAVKGADCYGIYFEYGEIIYAGPGSLAVETAPAPDKEYNCGIECQDMTVNGGTITAQGNKAEYVSCGIRVINNFTIKNGTVTAIGGEASYSIGICVDCVDDGNFSMENGMVTAIGGEAEYSSEGIRVSYGNLTMKDGEVTAIGGKAADNSCGIYVDDNFIIENGTVTATGGETDEYSSYGIYVYEYFTIKDGEVTAAGGEAAKYSYGIYVDDDFTIQDGKVIATGGEAGSDNSNGISSYNFIVENGTVTATGDKAGKNSYGINVRNNFTIGNGDITATGCQGRQRDYGIYVSKDFIINGGTVKAKGEKSADYHDYGIRSSNLYINGGKLTAEGRTNALYDSVQTYKSGSFFDILAVKGEDREFYNEANCPDLYTSGYTKVTIEEVEDYNLSVGGVRVSSGNADDIWGGGIKSGKVSYDKVTNTLTLKDAVIEAASKSETYPHLIYGILYTGSEDLTISFEGSNRILCGDNGIPGAYLNGISIQNEDFNLILEAKGEEDTLDILIADSARTKEVHGIIAVGDNMLTVKKGTVHIATGDQTGTGSVNYAVRCYRLSLAGGMLQADGGSGADGAAGIYTDDSLEVTGGTLVSRSAGKALQIGGIDLSGYTGVIVMAGNNRSGAGAAIIAEEDYGDLETEDYKYVRISDKELTSYPLYVGGMPVTSDNKDNIVASTISSGKVSYDPDTNILTLEDAVITGVAEDVYSSAAGIFYNDAARELTIEIKGHNEVAGKSKSNNSYGIWANYVKFGGDGELVAEGASGVTESYGIFSNKSIAFDGGNITARGGDATEKSYGLSFEPYMASDKSRTVYMNGGKLTAVAGSISSTKSTNVSCGINLDNYAADYSLSVGGGEIAAESGACKAASYGIEVSSLIDVSKQAKIRSQAGGSDSSYGIYAPDGMSISGRVEAYGGTPNSGGKSYGIFVNDSKEITVGSGEVLLIGRTQAVNQMPKNDSSNYVIIKASEDAEAIPADINHYLAIEQKLGDFDGESLDSYKTMWIGTESYNIWVGGMRITRANQGDLLSAAETDNYNIVATDTEAGLSYDPAEHKLILKNVSITGLENVWDGAGIYDRGIGSTLIVESIGTNKVKGTGDSDKNNAYGISVPENNLSFKGDGALSIETADVEGEALGVYVKKGTIQITEGELTAKAGNGEESIGLCADGDSILITNGKLVAKSGEGLYSVGVVAYGNIQITDGELSAEAGDADYVSYGISAGKGIGIEGGKLSAQAGNSDESFGIFIDDSSEKLIMTGGALSAIGENAALNKAPEIDAAKCEFKITVPDTEEARKEISLKDLTMGIDSYKNVAITCVKAYDLYVGGIRVTEKNKDDLVKYAEENGISTITADEDGEVRYDSEENILYLKNAVIEGGSPEAPCMALKSGLSSALTIHSEGCNTINGKYDAGFGGTVGIHADSKLIFNGDGELTVTTQDSAGGSNTAVSGGGEILLESGKLTVVSGNAGDSPAYGIRTLMTLSVEGGELYVEAGESADTVTGSVGISAGSGIYITDGSICAKAHTSAFTMAPAMTGYTDGKIVAIERGGSDVAEYDPAKIADYTYIWIGTEYSITVTGGTAAVSDSAVTKALPMTKISVKAEIPSGKVFDCWTSKDGIVFDDETKAETTFIMPAKDVAVEAVFQHIHTGEAVTGKVATCTEAGWKDYYRCTYEGCDELFEDEDCTKEITDLAAWKAEGGKGYLKALGHDAKLESGQAATCTEAGWNDYYTCNTCEKNYEDEDCTKEIIDLAAWKKEGGKGYLKALGHDAKLESGQAATCTEAGWNDYYTCSTCEKNYEDEDCTKEITDLAAWKKEGGKGHLKALGHDAKLEAGQAATCTEAGWNDYYTCSTCEKNYEDEDCTKEITDLAAWKKEGGKGHLKALGHAAKLESGQAATCTETGWKDYYTCSTCGKNYEDEDCMKEITDLAAWKTTEGQGLVSMKEHTYSTTYDKKDSDEAKHYHVCTVCGAKDSGAVHIWNVEAATTETDKHCTVCEYVAEPMVGHVHAGTLVKGQDSTCTETGWMDYYTCSCNKLFEDEACSEGKEITDLDAWKITEGKGLIAKKAHTVEKEEGKEATCTQEGWKSYYTCKVCKSHFEDEKGIKEITDLAAWKAEEGDGFLAKTEHTWSEDYKKEDSDAEKHYHVCTVCGAKDSGAVHIWNADAATTEMDKHCTVCEYVAEPMVGHVHEGTLVTGQDSTCTETGLKDYYTCSCGKIYEEESCETEITDLNAWKAEGGNGYLAALGHDWTADFDDEGHWDHCKRCDAFTEKTNHNFIYNEAEDSWSCNVCGCIGGLAIYIMDAESWVNDGKTAAYTYTAGAIKPAVTVKNFGKTLKEGVDYTVSYKNNTKASEGIEGLAQNKKPAVIVKGKGDFTGTTTEYFEIRKADLSMAEAGDIKVVSDSKAVPVLMYNGVKLTTKDYDNPNAAKKFTENEVITLTGRGNFKGEAKVKVTVVGTKKELKKFNVALGKEKLYYDGTPKTISYTLTDAADKTNVLTEGKHFYVAYTGNRVNTGTVKMTFVGMGEYTGSVVKTYTIKPNAVKDVNAFAVSGLKDGGYAYKTSGVKPEKDIKVVYKHQVGEEMKEETLVLGRDYTITFANFNKASTDKAPAKYTVKFIGNYKGSKNVTGTYRINKGILDNVTEGQKTEGLKVTLADMVYTGKPGTYVSKPVVSVDGIVLKAADYEVRYYLDEEMTKEIKGKNNNVAVEKTPVTVYVKIRGTGKGNYGNGTEANYVKASYRVMPKPESSLTDMKGVRIILKEKDDANEKAKTKFEYTGREVRPVVKVQVKDGKNWVDVEKQNEKFDVEYHNNTLKGTATVVVKAKDGSGYVGGKTVTFKIVSRNVTNLKDLWRKLLKSL